VFRHIRGARALLAPRLRVSRRGHGRPRLLLAISLGCAHAGTIEIVSGDLRSGDKSLDNIKGKWSQRVSVLGNAATVSGEYDRNANQNGLKEVSLSGAVDKIKYELTARFAGATDFLLSTETSDGTELEVEGDIALGKAVKVSKVTAMRAASLSGFGISQNCDLELSHELESNESKLKLSTLLGSGVKAVGLMTSKGADSSLSFEVGYDTTLTKGRTLSATVSPADGTGEIEFEDSATLDATINAVLPLGGAPKVTVKRSFGF